MAKWVKIGPALAVHSAEAVHDDMFQIVMESPAHLHHCFMSEQGAGIAQHTSLWIDTGFEKYFCDPQLPWRRGSNEISNDLFSQYFPWE